MAARFEFFTTVKIHVEVFWIVKPRGVAGSSHNITEPRRSQHEFSYQVAT